MPIADDLTDYLSLSLAGVVTAAGLVHARARDRYLPGPASAAVKRVITTTQAGSLREVFPRPADLEEGITNAIAALNGERPNPDVMRYSLHMIDLAVRLRRNSAATQRLGKALNLLPDASATSDAEFSAIYQDSISTLGKRIQITGDVALLQQSSVADDIRTLLLGGIRYAWLWGQLGGRRWHLILRRKSVLLALQALQHTVQSEKLIH